MDIAVVVHQIYHGPGNNSQSLPENAVCADLAAHLQLDPPRSK